jgi:hypothetical protein
MANQEFLQVLKDRGWEVFRGPGQIVISKGDYRITLKQSKDVPGKVLMIKGFLSNAGPPKYEFFPDAKAAYRDIERFVRQQSRHIAQDKSLDSMRGYNHAMEKYKQKGEGAKEELQTDIQAIHAGEETWAEGVKSAMNKIWPERMKGGYKTPDPYKYFNPEKSMRFAKPIVSPKIVQGHTPGVVSGKRGVSSEEMLEDAIRNSPVRGFGPERRQQIENIVNHLYINYPDAHNIRWDGMNLNFMYGAVPVSIGLNRLMAEGVL